MDATTETTSVERTITIAATRIEIDRWEPGATFTHHFDGGEHPSLRGKVIECSAPHRLVFTFGWERSGEEPPPVPSGSSTIEVELTPEGDGTSVRFLHRDLPNAEAATSHAHGWDHYLSRLETVAGGDDPGDDPWLTQDMASTS